MTQRKQKRTYVIIEIAIVVLIVVKILIIVFIIVYGFVFEGFAGKVVDRAWDNLKPMGLIRELN